VRARQTGGLDWSLRQSEGRSRGGARATIARLASGLGAEGLTATDRDTGSLLPAFARAGVVRLGDTLVGTAAYAVYQGELGVRFDSEELAQTDDIDFASLVRISVALVIPSGRTRGTSFGL